MIEVKMLREPSEKTGNVAALLNEGWKFLWATSDSGIYVVWFTRENGEKEKQADDRKQEAGHASGVSLGHPRATREKRRN